MVQGREGRAALVPVEIKEEEDVRVRMGDDAGNGCHLGISLADVPKEEAWAVTPQFGVINRQPNRLGRKRPGCKR